MLDWFKRKKKSDVSVKNEQKNTDVLPLVARDVNVWQYHFFLSKFQKNESDNILAKNMKFGDDELNRLVKTLSSSNRDFELLLVDVKFDDFPNVMNTLVEKGFSKHLRSLKLSSKNEMSNKDLNALVSLLQKSPNLKELDFFQNEGINDANIMSIVNSKENQGSVERLVLHDCKNITDKSVVKLVSILGNPQTKLNYIDVGGDTNVSAMMKNKVKTYAEIKKQRARKNNAISAINVNRGGASR